MKEVLQMYVEQCENTSLRLRRRKLSKNTFDRKALHCHGKLVVAGCIAMIHNARIGRYSHMRGMLLKRFIFP